MVVEASAASLIESFPKKSLLPLGGADSYNLDEEHGIPTTLRSESGRKYAYRYNCFRSEGAGVGPIRVGYEYSLDVGGFTYLFVYLKNPKSKKHYAFFEVEAGCSSKGLAEYELTILRQDGQDFLLAGDEAQITAAEEIFRPWFDRGLC